MGRPWPSALMFWAPEPDFYDTATECNLYCAQQIDLDHNERCQGFCTDRYDEVQAILAQKNRGPEFPPKPEEVPPPSPNFCCLSAGDAENMCSTCFPSAKAAPEGGACGVSKESCAACGTKEHPTKWCPKGFV